MHDRTLKREWNLSGESFQKLLQALDDNVEHAGERYEHLRRSLTKYFDWRGSLHPERDADETIDRVSRKLDEGQVFDDLTTYALGVARNVLLESLRFQQKEREAIHGFALLIDEKTDQRETIRFTCFDICLEQLPSGKQKLILTYYDGDKQRKIENRRRLAEELGVPIARLRIQAHRIRQMLEECIESCLAGTAETEGKP